MPVAVSQRLRSTVQAFFNRRGPSEIHPVFLDRLLSIGAFVATVGAVAIVISSRGTAGDDEPPAFSTIESWRGFAEAGHRRGPDSAPVTIVAFMDFSCGACQALDSLLSELRRAFPRSVATVYRHFPLNHIGYRAAIASECGARQDASAGNTRLFRTPDSLAGWTRAEVAARAGVHDASSFVKCMDDSTIHAVIWRDIHAGDSLYVRSTPALLINDRLIVGAIPTRRWLWSYVRSRR